MKQMNFPLFLLIALFSLNAGCKKENTLEDELAKLPPATQIGANTFGCLVNGKAWVAQNGCRLICDPAFTLYYDGAMGGGVTVRAEYNINNINQDIVLSTDSSNFLTVFNIAARGSYHTNFSFSNNNLFNQCAWISARDTNNVRSTGILVLTKHDLPNRIISGTFEFTLAKPGCDTIRATNGRFDGRLY